MTLDEFLSSYALPAEAVGNDIAFDGKIALRLAACSTGIRRDQDIELKDETGATLGFLCPTKSDEPVDVASLTDDRLCAFFTEAPVGCGQYYTFLHDYVVIPKEVRQRYGEQYLIGAPIWGGFVHDEPGVMPTQNASAAVEIVAKPFLVLPTSSHQRTLARAAREPYVFERFLKLYHMLELLFDYEFVQAIRGLGNDLHGVGKLMSSYKQDDTTRLKSLVQKYCLNHDALIIQLNKLANHKAKASDIFYHFGKDGNPIPDETDFITMLDAGGFTLAGFNAAGLGGAGKIPDFARRLTVYAIYRVRCCVAHHKIGEYLITDGDDVFLLEFAEPLLREVLCQVFQHLPAATPGAPVVATATAPIT